MIATLEIGSDNVPRRADVSAAANAVPRYETYVYVGCSRSAQVATCADGGFKRSLQRWVGLTVVRGRLLRGLPAEGFAGSVVEFVGDEG